MSKVERMRVFAGPNGSGKSTLFDAVSKAYKTGCFVNADLIEKELKEKQQLHFEKFGNLFVEQNDWDNFNPTESLVQKADSYFNKNNISISENKLFIASPSTINSYTAAIVASFIKQKLIENKLSFSFETVMSHRSKITEIIETKAKGYKTYLYFVCTDDPALNQARVQNRVAKGGHPVTPEKIQSRYTKTLDNLLDAIRAADTCFIFDNSTENMTLIAESLNGRQLEIKSDELPEWFINAVINKLS